MIDLMFEELYGINYHSFESFNLIIKPGKHLVCGENLSSLTEDSNGAGKSSIFESLPYASFKYTLRDKDPSTNQKGNSLVGYKLRKGSDQYKIERHINNKEYGNSVQIYLNDENITHRKNFSCEDEIKKILSISNDILITTIVVLQGLPTNFTQLGPTVRKALIEDYLGFSVWNDFRPRFLNNLKQVGLKRSTTSSAYENSKIELGNLNNKIETLKLMSDKDKNTNEKEIQDLKSAIRYGNESTDKILGERNKLSAMSLSDLSSYIDELKHSLTLLSSRSRSLKSTIDNKICSECEQSFPEVKIKLAQDELNHIQDKIVRIEHLCTENVLLRDLIVKHESNIKEITIRCKEFLNRINIIVENKNKEDLNLDIDVLNLQLNERLQEVNILFNDLAAVDKSIDNVKYVDSLLLPSSKFRTKVLEQYLDYINSIILSVSPLVFDGIVIKLVVDARTNGVELDITKDGLKKSYKSLSGGERRRIDLICVLSFQKFITESSGIRSNLLVFDEVFDNLDRKGVECILSSLDVLFPDSSSIYVITHNNSLKSLFTSIIKVVKENNISRLVCA